MEAATKTRNGYQLTWEIRKEWAPRIGYPAEDKPHLLAYLPLATSQSFNSPGALEVVPPAETKVLPSGLNATDQTASVPRRLARCFPVATSHNLTDLSFPPAEARILPSGLNATDNTDSV